jgi:hypothetical protein
VWILGPIVGALLASFFLEPEAAVEEGGPADLAPRAPEVMPGGERSEEVLVATEVETVETVETAAPPLPDSET